MNRRASRDTTLYQSLRPRIAELSPPTSAAKSKLLFTCRLTSSNRRQSTHQTNWLCCACNTKSVSSRTCSSSVPVQSSRPHSARQQRDRPRSSESTIAIPDPHLRHRRRLPPSHFCPLISPGCRLYFLPMGPLVSVYWLLDYFNRDLRGIRWSQRRGLQHLPNLAAARCRHCFQFRLPDLTYAHGLDSIAILRAPASYSSIASQQSIQASTARFSFGGSPSQVLFTSLWTPLPWNRLPSHCSGEGLRPCCIRYM